MILEEIKNRLKETLRTAEDLNKQEPDIVYSTIATEAQDALEMIAEVEKQVSEPVPF